MPTGLPDLIDPLVLCQQQKGLTGSLPVASMARLKGELLEPFGVAEFAFDFSMNEEHLPVITGQVTAQVRSVCQRCLAPMELVIEGSVRLRVVRDENKAAQLAEPWEPLIYAGGEQLALVELVEDELLVEFPAICLHPAGECRQPVNGSSSQETAESTEKSNPFHLLSQLKTSRD